MKKYELVKSDSIEFDGHTLYRVVAAKNFNCNNSNNCWDVKEFEDGGYIESEYNLSQEGGCWITDSCRVYGNARIEGNACLSLFTIVRDNATIRDNVFCSECTIGGNTILDGNKEYTKENINEEIHKFKVNDIVGLIKKLSEEERHELYKILMSEDLL